MEGLVIARTAVSLVTCIAAPPHYHNGNNATQALCTPIIYESDAHTPRWGPSNRVWMRVFLQNRVKVLYGARMTIARITCR